MSNYDKKRPFWKTNTEKKRHNSNTLGTTCVYQTFMLHNFVVYDLLTNTGKILPH